MDNAKDINDQDIGPIAIKSVLYIANILYLLGNGFLLFTEGLNTIYAIGQNPKKILPSFIYISLAVFMIVKELKFKRLWVKLLFNFIISILFLLTFASANTWLRG